MKIVNAAIYEYPDGTLQVEGVENRFVYAIALLDPDCPETYIVLDPGLAAGELAEEWDDPGLVEWLEGGVPLAAVLRSLLEKGYAVYRGWVRANGDIITSGGR